MKSVLLHIASQKGFFEPTYVFHHDGAYFVRESLLPIQFIDTYVSNDQDDEHIDVELRYNHRERSIGISVRKAPGPELEGAFKAVFAFIDSRIGVGLTEYADDLISSLEPPKPNNWKESLRALLDGTERRCGPVIIRRSTQCDDVSTFILEHDETVDAYELCTMATKMKLPCLWKGAPEYISIEWKRAEHR